MGMDVSDVRAMRATAADFMVDACVNSRTGQTKACRVYPQTKTLRLPELPRYLRLPTWHIKMPDGTAVDAGDTLTVSGSGAGTYTVIAVLNPGTYSTSTDTEAIMARRSDGSVGIAPNATVSFRQRSARPGHTQPDTIGPFEVMVDYLDPEMVPAGSDFAFRIAMTWSDTIVFPDGQKPGEGDFVIWTGVANGRAALRFPRPLVVLPALTAYLDGTPA